MEWLEGMTMTVTTSHRSIGLINAAKADGNLENIMNRADET